mgnify:FL=1
MCIYQRVAVVGLILAPLPAIIKPDNLIARLVSLIASLTAAIWGLRIAYEHVQMQNPDNFMLLLGCDVIPNFPQWLPLHQWLPGIFEARGTCGDIDWSFLGQSMPQWMVIIFAGYSLAIASVYTVRLVKIKTL